MLSVNDKIREAIENIEYAADVLREVQEENEKIANDIERIVELLEEAMDRLESLI